MLLKLENDRALDIPPSKPDFPIADDFRLPVDVDVLAVYPHAHYLGKLLEAYATLPDGSRRWLIRIPGVGRQLAGRLLVPLSCFPAERHSGLDAIPLRQLGSQSRAIRIRRPSASVPATNPRTRWGISGCRSSSAAKATSGPFCRKR